MVKSFRFKAWSTEMRAAAHTAISGISAFAIVALIKQQNPAARLPHPGFAALVRVQDGASHTL